MNLHHRQDFFLLGFIFFSLLLHLVLLYLAPQREWLSPPVRRQPVLVEIRPPQPPPVPRQREEIPLPQPDEEIRREKPAKRLGERDLSVRKETAPQGEDVDDLLPGAPPPPATPRRPSPPPPAATKRPAAPPRTASAPPSSRLETSEPAAPERKAAPEVPEVPERVEVPDLQSLLQLPPATVARLDQEWRRKYRSDVEKGDAVWLDTEKDLLISFFQRFRNNLYGVWNYPVRARDRGEEGTCLLKITVNRDGHLEKVQLMESSGSSALDEEALEAVRKASPFGALPRAYEPERLSIFAFFEYRLMRRVIY